MAERKRKAPLRRKTTSRKTNKNNSSNRQLYIIGGILVALLVLLLGIYLGMSAASKSGLNSNTKPQTPLTSVQKEVTTQNNETATIEDADKAIKLAMFNLNIGSDAIVERKMDEGSLPVLSFNMKLSKEDKDSLTAELIPILEELGFKVTMNNILSASNAKCSVFISFIEEKTKKPKDTDKNIILPSNAPKLAVVIDDCGYSLSLAKRLAAIKYPVTFAILPHLPYDVETAEIARAAGKTVFLHFPMEPLSYPSIDPGKGAVLLNMPPSIIEVQAENNVKTIGKIDGFNNHMGSAFTENSKKMEQVLSYMKKYTDTFLDSYTSGKTVAYDVCLELGMTCAQNKKFIDNENNEQYIRKKLMEAVDLAKKNGNTILIGHLKEETVGVLEKHLQDVERAGVRIVPVKELMHKKK